VSTPDTTKWVQVDLGSDQNLAQISLFPARPTNDTSGDVIGAASRCAIWSRRATIDLRHRDTVVDRTGADQPNPGISA